jgi:2-hydroxy-3-keto-5-methylthiopentenyl-1-phosphate phosphatase
MTLKVFVDFDGTITEGDVGNSFFLRFGGELCNALVQEYREGKITAAECFRREISAIDTLSRAELNSFLASQRIDPTFSDFIVFCRGSGIEFHIVSDGLDYYIDRILEANGITGVSIYSNTLEVSPGDANGRSTLTIAFPFPDAECGVCACCKRNIMLTHAGEEDVIAYVGEGFSDQCPVRYADIVFAKDSLQTFCQQQNISYYRYESFADVVARLRELLARKRLRKRHRAELLRRELFASEP